MSRVKVNPYNLICMSQHNPHLNPDKEKQFANPPKRVVNAQHIGKLVACEAEFTEIYVHWSLN
jgi:hypothetical protein